MTEMFKVGPADYGELAEFLAGFEAERETAPLWRNRFELWWDGNPAFGTEHERGWGLRDGSKLVGFIGIFPSRWQRDGQEVTAYNCTTWRVRPEYRNESLRLLFAQIEAAKETILFATTPRTEVVEMLKGLKFRAMGTAAGEKTCVMVLNWKKLLGAKAGPWSGRGSIGLMAAAGKVVQAVRLRKLGRRTRGEVREVAAADGDFDALWQQSKRIYGHTRVRSAAAVNWYCRDKNHEKMIFGCYEAGRLTGYMVCWSKMMGKIQTRVLECLDVWTEPEGRGATAALVRYVKGYAEDNGYDLVMLPQFHAGRQEELRRLGVLEVGLARREAYFKAKESTAESMVGPGCYFAAADGDYGM